jgi:plastocyanin
MMSDIHGARSGIHAVLLVAALAAALGLDAAPSFAPVDTPAASDSLRVVTVEDWTAPHDSAQPVSLGPTGSLVGRVDIHSAREMIVRRPNVSGLAAPPRTEPTNLRPAVVYVESAPGGAAAAPEPMRARIDQRDETFVPHLLAVTAGSVVDFPNSDRTYHNVFSLSRTRRFDLGRYAQGRSRSVRFDRPGVVRVFCDIHSHMSAYILVFAHRFFATTDAEGRYRIDDVPPGRYTVHAWFEGEPRDTRAVTLPSSGGPMDLDFSVP